MMDPASLGRLRIQQQILDRATIDAAYAQMRADGTTHVGLFNPITIDEWRDRELAKPAA